MDQIGDRIEMDQSICGRRLPGIYFLLTHVNSAIRSWAVQMTRVMGVITVEVFRKTIQPIFRTWYQVCIQTLFLRPAMILLLTIPFLLSFYMAYVSTGPRRRIFPGQ